MHEHGIYRHGIKEDANDSKKEAVLNLTTRGEPNRAHPRCH